MQALRNEPITIYGDGSQTRSFCYVDDLISAIVAFMATPSAVTGPLNMGNPEECTIRALAELIVELTNSASEILHKPLPADDPKQRRPDLSLTAATLNWNPRTSLREGLEKTISYFSELLARRHV
jgi:UDP-glucuronate decarboxylase